MFEEFFERFLFLGDGRFFSYMFDSKNQRFSRGFPEVFDFRFLVGLLVASPASPAKAGPDRPAEAGAGCLSGPAGLGGKIYGIASLRVTCNPETSKLDIQLQSTVSLSIQAKSTDYSKISSKSAAATNSFLVLHEPTKKVQDYKQMKLNGAVSCVWDHFSVYDPKYNRKSQAVCNHCFLKYT